MRAAKSPKQPAKAPAAIDLEAELERIAGMNINELRSLWREREGRGLPQDAQAEPARRIKPPSVIVREYAGARHKLFVLEGGFSWQGRTYPSLSAIAKEITGTRWNGPRFFGLTDEQAQSAASQNAGGSS
jgi:hypothetical protein